jgi:hypothetical protein
MTSYLLPSDQDWPDEKMLIAELSKLNAHVARYVLHQLDADAQQADPPSMEEERALSEHLATLAGKLQARADRRTVLGDAPLTVEGGVTLPSVTEGDTQTEKR